MQITNDGNVVKIAGTLEIGQVEQLRQALLALVPNLAKQEGCVLDLSAVEACDLSALQLLYSLRANCVVSQQAFRLAATPPAVVESASALGLAIDDLTFAPTAAQEVSHA